MKWIREQPDLFDGGLSKRGLAPLSAGLIALDQRNRALLTTLQDMQNRRNSIAKDIGMIKKSGGDASALMEEATTLRDQLPALEAEQEEVKNALHDMLSSTPNLPRDDVPVGPDETANQIVRTHGIVPSFSFTPKEHFDLGEALGMMNFEQAAKMSGSRFVVLKKDLAQMERALISFMLNLHTQEFGYEETIAPYLVKDAAVYGVGHLPKSRDDMFQTTNGYWLISTAEASLTNLVSGDILDEAELPKRFTGFSPCFRSEAGAAGRDTRGMLRQHQFHKVELVSIVHPDHTTAEHERMVSAAEEVLKRLGLAYRVSLLCTGDMGFSSQKTYDLDVWMPGQNTYREISSCSQCGDFQARRMNTRFREKETQKTRFVHTLNGSGLAVGRTLIAILENYQQEDGSIRIPGALQPYMNGKTVITRA